MLESPDSRSHGQELQALQKVNERTSASTAVDYGALRLTAFMRLIEAHLLTYLLTLAIFSSHYRDHKL